MLFGNFFLLTFVYLFGEGEKIYNHFPAVIKHYNLPVKLPNSEYIYEIVKPNDENIHIISDKRLVHCPKEIDGLTWSCSKHSNDQNPISRFIKRNNFVTVTENGWL